MLDGGERLDGGSWKESGGLGGVLEARLAFKGQSGLFPFLPSSAVMSPSRATLNFYWKIHRIPSLVPPRSKERNI